MVVNWTAALAYIVPAPENDSATGMGTANAPTTDAVLRRRGVSDPRKRQMVRSEPKGHQIVEDGEMTGTTTAGIIANGNAMAGGIGTDMDATTEDALVTEAAVEEAVAITVTTDAAQGPGNARHANGETLTTSGMVVAAEMASANDPTPVSATTAARLESRPAHVRSINHMNYNATTN